LKAAPPKPPPIPSSASSIRQITCSTGNFGPLKKLSWRKAGLPKGFIVHGFKRGAKEGAITNEKRITAKE
jgi:hypothetical protein